MDDFRIDIDGDVDEKVADLSDVKMSAHDSAEKIADVARSTAPVGETGDYRDQIMVQDTKSGARVLASAPESAFVEFGVPSQGQPAQFNLRKAAVTAGFKFKKRGR